MLTETHDPAVIPQFKWVQHYSEDFYQDDVSGGDLLDFEWTPVNIEEISKIITQLKCGKAVGIDAT